MINTHYVKSIQKLIFLTIFTILFTSCGYKNFSLPGSNVKLDIPPFGNSSIEPGLGRMVADRVKTDLIKRSNFEIVNKSNMADYKIIGNINNIVEKIASVSKGKAVKDYRMTIQFRVNIFDTSNKHLLKENRYKLSSVYHVTGNTMADMTGKSQSIEEISSLLAEKIIANLLDNASHTAMSGTKNE